MSERFEMSQKTGRCFVGKAEIVLNKTDLLYFANEMRNGLTKENGTKLARTIESLIEIAGGIPEEKGETYREKQARLRKENKIRKAREFLASLEK